MVSKRKKSPAKQAKFDSTVLIEKKLQKLTKPDLVATILRLAMNFQEVSRELECELDVQKPGALLMADIDSAIFRATAFDERDINHNFDFDWQAYEEIKKGLELLLDQGQLEVAKDHALKLMRDGSLQVEYSDEGLMTDEIENCLRPVILAVRAGNREDAKSWALKMRKADRVGFICQTELKLSAEQT